MFYVFAILINIIMEDITMIVYKVTNKITEKVYIGITKHSLDHRRKSHEGNRFHRNYHFYRSMRKHGTDAFVWEVIETVDTWEQAIEREMYYINEYGSYVNGYNMTKGGDGGAGAVWTDEMRR